MSVARRASSQLLASRSVHLRIQPRPSNLSESREIFRVLQQFGAIDTYKYLRYEYHNPADNSALAIYRDANSAQQALNASPLRFALEKAVDNDDDGPLSEDDSETETESNASHNLHDRGISELLRPSQLINRTLPHVPNPHAETPTTSSTPPPMPLQPKPEIRRTHTKWFQVTVDRSRVIHRDYVERQPYWKQFTPMKSMAQEDLAKVVPHMGLSDVSKRPPHAHRTPNKVLKMMSNYVEHGLPSLKDMYEEGGREKS